MVPKLQVDLSKEVVGILGLFKRREYLISYVLLPILLCMLTGLIGLDFFSRGFSFSSIDALLIGYVICTGFTFLMFFGLISADAPFSIDRPRTILVSLGISFFLAYFCGRIFIGFLIPVYYPNINPKGEFYNLIAFSASFLPMAPFLAYLLGGFFIIYLVLISRIDFPERPQLTYAQRKALRMQKKGSSRSIREFECTRCGNPLPAHAKFCDSCAYPVDLPYQDHTSYQQVSFQQAVRLLDSDHYQRGSRMNIEFECIVHQPASSEQFGGPAPHRTLRVTDHLGFLSRTLYIWGDQGYRYNINLASTLQPGDRILVIGPRRPKDSPYYKDHNGEDVFWIERWNGKSGSSGTRLLKLEDVSQMKPEKPVIPSIKAEITQTKVEYFAPSNDLSVSPPFYCQICSIKHAAGTPRLQCDSCGRYVCTESYESMKLAGRDLCPMCEGTLNPV